MLTRIASILALTLFGALGCSKAAPPAPAPPASSVDIVVDETGFVPATIRAAVDQPLTLRVTRKTERTCATEIVIKQQSINQPLPLNQTVVVSFTPHQKGSIRFACGMDMIAGTILVE